ncbi:hypothetical protein HHL21_03290 [Massilia sp. RP-1-19]|uniref:Uncharacterized protein n=1 Tax=Massilia polaris TaxID=2728846 RepID=A0A848HFY6_9BURK|nr:hypothetical protein [Massilia polaris]NML60124.1 hypothetical protein [Massilia polaris]
MSAYVYIAYEGLRTSPISVEAWLAAVNRCDKLILDKAVSFRAHGQQVVRLKSARRASVRLDRFGIAGARDPSEELIRVMFDIASLLGANVYSERFNKYASADDCVCRRTKHRRTFDKQRACKERQELYQFGLWCAVCVSSALFGFLFGSLYLALTR